MADSHDWQGDPDYWQEASVPCHMGLSLGLYTTLITWCWFLPDCDPEESKAKDATSVMTVTLLFLQYPIGYEG